MESSLVEDADRARAFIDIPRTVEDRVVLEVGGERLALNRWGTVLVSALAAGSPMLHKAVKVLRLRRIKRPGPAVTRRSSGASIPVSTAVVAAPLDQGGSAPLDQGSSASPGPASKPTRATRRAARRVRRYASGDIRVATDDEAARRFLTHALATPDPVVAVYTDREIVFTPDGSRAVLALFITSHLRLALVHLLLGADAYRPRKEASSEEGVEGSPTESSDPSDPWGPFSGDSTFLSGSRP